MKNIRKKLFVIVALLTIILIGINFYNSQKTIWFEGSNEIDSNIEHIENSLNDLGQYFVGITSNMPGITKAELVEEGDNFVTLRTNEGLMIRTNISKKTEGEKIVLEFDEEYQAGEAITAKSHFKDEFEQSNTVVIHHFTISNLTAPGFMGFFYRNFGSSNIGKAFLNAHKSFFEEDNKKE